MIGKLATAFVAASSLALVSTANASPSYNPFGPQNDVSLATVAAGGWSVCYTSTYGTPFGNDASAALAGCTGDLLMLAGRLTDGATTYDVLAEAPRADVLFDTSSGDQFVTHLANGSEWYYAAQWSWGFAGLGDSVNKFSCDVDGPSERDRLCWHTIDFTGGYRSGDHNGLNSDDSWTRVILQANLAEVPEPSTLALIATTLLSLLGAGLMHRRPGA